MTLDAGAQRVNRLIMRETGGHMPGTLPALLAQRDDWETPLEILRDEQRRRGWIFDLDPCANAANAVCDRYFDVELDGLKQPWSGYVWLHPPHSQAPLWARKAVLESQRRRDPANIVALLPARTAEGWFHDYVIQWAKSIRYLRGTPGFRLRRLPVKPDERPLPIGGFAIVTFGL